MWQLIIVGLLVVACAAYALWVLLPAAARLRLAQRLSGGPGPLAGLGRRLERAARPATAPGAGCEACPQSRIGLTSTRKPPSSG